MNFDAHPNSARYVTYECRRQWGVSHVVQAGFRSDFGEPLAHVLHRDPRAALGQEQPWMLWAAERRTNLVHVLIDDLRCPVEHGQHCAALRAATPLRLPPPHVQLAVAAELRKPQMRTEIDGVE